MIRIDTPRRSAPAVTSRQRLPPPSGVEAAYGCVDWYIYRQLADAAAAAETSWKASDTHATGGGFRGQS